MQLPYLLRHLLFQFCFASMSAIFLLSPSPLHAQEPAPELYLETKPTYLRGKVSRIISERQLPDQSQDAANGQPLVIQELEVTISTGAVVGIGYGSEFQPLAQDQRLSSGTEVIVAQVTLPDGELAYAIVDTYRLPALAWLLVGFLVLVTVVAKYRGLLAALGMFLSIGMLFGLMVPALLQGKDPLVVIVLGASAIAALTLYLSHGWHLKTHIALASLITTLLAVVVLASLSIELAQLVGLGTEEAAFLQLSVDQAINLRGLLLGGIILGALGVLDDIVVSQVSVVAQLKAANTSLSFEELYTRALEVGKDHVASLVNTLVLAYAGANLPLFLLFYLSQETPWWVNVNSQIIAEEVVRTLVGSISLVVAVPFATVLAAALLSKHSLLPKVSAHHHHHH